MHIFHSGITCLQFLLEDSTLVKVGVGISGDCAKVLRDYNVSDKRTFPIMQTKRLVGEPKTWGLHSSKDSCLQRDSMQGITEGSTTGFCALSRMHIYANRLRQFALAGSYSESG